MESKQNETFARLFPGTNVIQETWSGSQRRNDASTRQEGAPTGVGSGNSFFGALGCFQGTWIYIGEGGRSGEPRGAHEGGGAPTPLRVPSASWKVRGLPVLYSKSPRLHLFQERSSRRFRSVWIPFDIPFFRNTEIGKKTAICTRPLVNRLVPKII